MNTELKYFYILLIVFVFIGCKNSTGSKITGTWDSSYTDNDIIISSTTTFSEGKNKYFKTKGELVTSNERSRYNCKFSARGDFRITENDILIMKYIDINFYDYNSDEDVYEGGIFGNILKDFASDYTKGLFSDILERWKNQTFSYKILSIDSENMIVEGINTYDKITFFKNKYSKKEREREFIDKIDRSSYNSDKLQIEFETKLSTDLPCYESAKLQFVKVGNSKKVNAAVIVEDKWTTILYYKGNRLVANIYHDGTNKPPVATTADIDCDGGPIKSGQNINAVAINEPLVLEQETNSEYVKYGSLRLGFDPQTFEGLRVIHKGGRVTQTTEPETKQNDRGGVVESINPRNKVIPRSSPKKIKTNVQKLIELLVSKGVSPVFANSQKYRADMGAESVGALLGKTITVDEYIKSEEDVYAEKFIESINKKITTFNKNKANKNEKKSSNLRRLVRNYYQYLEGDNWSDLEKMFPPILTRFYGEYNYSKFKVLTAAKDYKSKFNILSTEYNVRWETFKVNKKGDNYIVSFIMDYELIKRNSEKRSFVLTIFMEFDENSQIRSIYENKL